jgi:hypothetical protein
VRMKSENADRCRWYVQVVCAVFFTVVDALEGIQFYLLK